MKLYHIAGVLGMTVLLAADCWGQVPTSSGDSTATSDAALGHFNTASKQYVKGQKMDALRTLDKALHQFPGDPRLLKLAEELVKEEQEQQQQQQQQQDQKKSEQEKKEQEKKEQQKQEQEKQEQDKQGQEKKEREMQPEPGRISPQDAKRILDALEREEKAVQAKVREKQQPTERRITDKDW